MRQLVILATTLLALSGCRRTAAGDVRTRFQNEFECSAAVHSENLGANTWRVSGCGRRATYVCVAHPSSTTCVRDDGGGASAGLRPGTTQAGRGRMRRGVARGAPALSLIFDFEFEVAMLCTPGRDRSSIEVSRSTGRCRDVMFTLPSGPIRGMETTRTRGRFSIPLADFSRAANGSSLEVAACGEQTELSEREIGLLRRFVEACAARDAAAQPTSGGEAATTPPSGGHDEVRAWLDARRDLVLGCTGGRAAFIRIGWDEAGAHVALGPPLAGTPEEACVVHGLGEVPDGSGDLIHPITP